MSNYKIRAHHGMCLRFFREKGYNSSFVENMKSVSSILSKNPLITIVDHGDDICVECPNYEKNGSCRYQEKVNGYDSKVLQYCSLESGSTMYWNDFQDAVYKNIIEVHKRCTICKDCNWNEICESYNQET